MLLYCLLLNSYIVYLNYNAAVNHFLYLDCNDGECPGRSTPQCFKKIVCDKQLQDFHDCLQRVLSVFIQFFSISIFFISFSIFLKSNECSKRQALSYFQKLLEVVIFQQASWHESTRAIELFCNCFHCKKNILNQLVLNIYNWLYSPYCLQIKQR